MTRITGSWAILNSFSAAVEAVGAFVAGHPIVDYKGSVWGGQWGCKVLVGDGVIVPSYTRYPSGGRRARRVGRLFLLRDTEPLIVVDGESLTCCGMAAYSCVLAEHGETRVPLCREVNKHRARRCVGLGAH